MRNATFEAGLKPVFHWQMYRKLRNCANREEKKLKSEYYCRLIEDAKGDSSKTWKEIKETLPSNHSEINAIPSDCKFETDPKSTARTLTDHFSSIGKRLSKAYTHWGESLLSITKLQR